MQLRNAASMYIFCHHDRTAQKGRPPAHTPAALASRISSLCSLHGSGEHSPRRWQKGCRAVLMGKRRAPQDIKNFVRKNLEIFLTFHFLWHKHIANIVNNHSQVSSRKKKNGGKQTNFSFNKMTLKESEVRLCMVAGFVDTIMHLQARYATLDQNHSVHLRLSGTLDAE